MIPDALGKVLFFTRTTMWITVGVDKKTLYFIKESREVKRRIGQKATVSSCHTSPFTYYLHSTEVRYT